MKSVPIGDTDLFFEDRGQGTPLLLVHGFPLSHRQWTDQLDALASTYRVLAPDLRGFGSSIEGTVPPLLTMDALAEDLALLVQRMVGDEPVVFCGLSMGGYIGWQFWSQHADRLKALILCDTRADADGPQGVARRNEMADRVLREGSSAVADAMIPMLLSDETRDRQPAVTDAVRRMIVGTDPNTIAAAQRGMAQRPDMRHALSRIAVPTLLLVGEHDPLSTPETMAEMAADIPGARLVTVPHAGHLPPMENPAETNDALRTFLERLN